MVESALSMLHPKLRDAMARLGYSGLLPVQEKAIPVILRGVHTLITSPTGTGKTEAALFPVLSMMLKRFRPGDGKIKAIYVTPLRALNRDITLRISRLVREVGFNIALRHGDSTTSVRRKFLESPPDFMVTTPETLNLILTVQRQSDMWDQVSFVIVDEVQELLDSKRGAELSVVLERLQRRSRAFIQRIGLSATLSEKSKRAAANLLAYGRGVEVVEDRGERTYNINIVSVNEEDDLNKVVEVITSLVNEERGSTLLFTNTRSVAEKLGAMLSKRLGDAVMVHHGSLSRSVREEAEKRFREGQLKLLVATSSMELGIDIGHVDRVLQFMSPREVISMTQRAGRAGHRYGGVSNATIITFDNVYELLESAVIASRTKRGELEDLAYPTGSLDVAAHQLVALVIEGLADNLGEAYDLMTRAGPLSSLSLEQLERVAEHLDSVRVIRFEPETGRLAKGRRSITYLYKVSMIPDEASFRVYDVATNEQVGEVGERFVEAMLFSNREERPTFVLAGRAWRIVNIDYENLRIDAEPLTSSEGVIPSWEGELIPVSYKVAREVCAILSMASIDPENALRMLTARGLGEKDAKKVIDVMSRTSASWGFPLTMTEPVIEEVRGVSILYACLGSKGNLLLALVLSKLMEPTIKVWFDYIPYAIVFSSPHGVNAEEVRKALIKARSLDLPELMSMAYDAVRSTPLYVVRFLQVAKRMGVIDPDARVSLEQGKRILEAYRGSVVDEETLREIAFDKLDPEALEAFLRSIKDVKVVRGEAPSPLAEEVIRNPYLRREIAVNLKDIAIDYVITGLRTSALKKEVLFVCTHCGNMWRSRASDLVHPVRCPRCGVLMVAPLPSSQWGEDMAKLYVAWKRGQLKSPTKEQKRYIEEVNERAAMYVNYAAQGLGKYVVEALLTQGVGPKAAKKAMSELMKGGERAFYEALLKAKENYLVYKKFIKREDEGKDEPGPQA
ncbi:MAG: DEAD/DEAH box helicase [Acidilobus sp.]